MRNIIALTLLSVVLGCSQETPPPTTPDAPANGIGIPSGTYAVDRTHAYVTFSYLHQNLSYPLIRAGNVDGELNLDADNLANSSVNVAIAADSIRTNTDYFDEELASPKFFNAGRYPYITFASSDYEPTSATTGNLNGIVTIRGIQKPLMLSVTVNGALTNPITKLPVIGLSATGTLNRSDFGLDRFIPAVADRVDVSVEIEFAQGSNDGSRAAASRAESGAAESAD